MQRTINAIGLAAGALIAGDESAARRAARLREGKLRDLLRHAGRHVPFYRELFQKAGISTDDLGDPGVLARLPITTKEQLRAAGSGLLSEKHTGNRLGIELTSGSSGQPFAVHCDREYVIARNCRFLRGLFSIGYRPGAKLMLVTARSRTAAANMPRWHYASLTAPVEEQARFLRELRPHFLYGAMTALRLLAEHLESEPARSFSPPARVITTAEAVDDGTREYLERVFLAPVSDFYGMTETGLVAWQRERGTPYVVAEDGVVVEQLPVAEDLARAQLAVTNLDLWAMPVIRYATGDVGVFSRGGAKPDALLRVEGRLVDCIVGAEGQRFSPYQLTMALQDVRGISRFRIRQVSLEDIEVELRAARASDGALVAAAAADRLRRVVGTHFRIRARVVDEFPLGPRGKFRVVESVIGRDYRVRADAAPIGAGSSASTGRDS